MSSGCAIVNSHGSNRSPRRSRYVAQVQSHSMCRCTEQWNWQTRGSESQFENGVKSERKIFRFVSLLPFPFEFLLILTEPCTLPLDDFRKKMDRQERKKKTIINNHLISKRFDKNSTGKWWFATETFQLNVFIFLRHRAIKTHSFCLHFKRMCLGLGQITPSHSYIHVRFSLFDKLNALHFNSFIRDSNRIHMRCHVNETEVLYLKHLSASPSNARAAAAAADTSLHRDCVNTRSHVSISSYQQSSHIHLEHTRFGSPKWFGTRARARTHTKWKTIFENEKKSIAGDKQPPKHRHFAMETVNHEK